MQISWIECKEVCRDCPISTNVTNKSACQHPWRHLINNALSSSGGDTVPFSTPEQCASLGAVVSRKTIDGRRPSVQVYIDEPPAREGFIKAKITQD